MKTERWNGHTIRFVEVEGEWCGVAKDIADALDYRDANSMTKKLKDKYLVYAKMADMNQKYLALTEFGIYKAIFGSHKPEAEQFQDWVFNVIKSLRQSAGLEGFQVFRTMDKQFQRDQMDKLKEALPKPCPRDFIKANNITNKAVSNMYGLEKMAKKADMTPNMLRDREPVLAETVALMGVVEKFGLPLKVSTIVYDHVGID